MAFNANQIKKILYKEKPIASLYDESKSIIPEANHTDYYYYSCMTTVGEFKFKIPKNDAPNNISIDEPAQLLIRWLEIEE